MIHGVSNQPEREGLRALWTSTLERDGVRLGDRGVESAMIYWADVLYAAPEAGPAGDEDAAPGDEVLAAAREPVTFAGAALPPAERAFVDRLARTLGVTAEDLDPAMRPPDRRDARRHERLPLPAWLRNRLMARFVCDAHLYFFNKAFTPRAGVTFRVRDELRRRFVQALRDAGGAAPLVVLSHSMGSIVAYDCLAHEDACPPIDALVTVGSPLGLDEVQDFLPRWTRENGFPSARLRGPWVNVFDRLDLIAAADPAIADDYRREGRAVVEDLEEPNWGPWRHSITKYLQGPKLRARLAQLLGVDWP
jgi:hypothetical protein